MSSHTPGPWAAIYGGDYIVPAEHKDRRIGWSIDEDRNRDHYAQVIANMPTNDDEFGRGSKVANARLIAAAPDLLDVCRRITACPLAAVELSRAGIWEDLNEAIENAMYGRETSARKDWAVRFESVDDEPETAGPFTLKDAEVFAEKKKTELKDAFGTDDWSVEIVSATLLPTAKP